VFWSWWLAAVCAYCWLSLVIMTSHNPRVCGILFLRGTMAKRPEHSGNHEHLSRDLISWLVSVQSWVSAVLSWCWLWLVLSKIIPVRSLRGRSNKYLMLLEMDDKFGDPVCVVTCTLKNPWRPLEAQQVTPRQNYIHPKVLCHWVISITSPW